MAVFSSDLEARGSRHTSCRDECRPNPLWSRSFQPLGPGSDRTKAATSLQRSQTRKGCRHVKTPARVDGKLAAKPPGWCTWSTHQAPRLVVPVSRAAAFGDDVWSQPCLLRGRMRCGIQVVLDRQAITFLEVNAVSHRGHKDT